MATKLIKPRIYQEDDEWWMEFEGHATNEICQSPNGEWTCGVFRLTESIHLIITHLSDLVLRFPVDLPLVIGISNAGVAATVEYAPKGEKRLCFFFPDGALAKTDPIKELAQTDRIFFHTKYSEVNLLSEGRILNVINFGEMDATLVRHAVVYKRDTMKPFRIAAGIFLLLVVLCLLGYWIVVHFLSKPDADQEARANPAPSHLSC